MLSFFKLQQRRTALHLIDKWHVIPNVLFDNNNYASTADTVFTVIPGRAHPMYTQTWSPLDTRHSEYHNLTDTV